MTPDSALLAILSEDLHELADSAEAAYQAAAEERKRSVRSLRDELRELADDESTVEIACADGSDLVGTIREVGLDYIVLADAAQTRLVALFHIAAVSYASSPERAAR